jgi:hypothetical protein
MQEGALHGGAFIILSVFTDRPRGALPARFRPQILKVGRGTALGKSKNMGANYWNFSNWASAPRRNRSF